MNSASRENVSAYEWQGRCSSFRTVNVAVTRRFHLCSWLSRYAPEFPCWYPSAFLMSSELTYSQKHWHWEAGGQLSTNGVLRPPADPCLFLHFFPFLIPSMPTTEPPTEVKHRIVERFQNTSGQKTKSKNTGQLWPCVWMQEHPEAWESWRMCLSQGTKTVADFIWVTAPALVSYK